MNIVFVTLALSIGLVMAAETDPEILLLKKQLAEQQKQIDELRDMLKLQQMQLARVLPVPEPKAEVAVAVAAPAPAAELKTLSSDVEKIGRNLGGFAFSGDFRYRLDLQNRHANALGSGLQNDRNRYRVRLNVDKQINPQFKFHLQLSTGSYINQLTNDQDFGAFGVKVPFSIAEASVSYAPTKDITLSVGRMREAFYDDTRFVWDDDIRFTGFEQKIRLPFSAGKLFKSFELRAGEYVLTNPNTLIVPPDSTTTPSPYARAGFPVGTRVGATNLFHPGAVISGDLGAGWTHQIIFDTQVWRNPNQIALASTSFGPGGLINGPLGLTISGPIAASANGLTTPGGAMFTAKDFTIPRIDYRLNRTNFLKLGGKTLPGYFELQVSRNTSAAFLRDAVMGLVSIGAVRKPGDGRFLYSYSIKDANALIAQFTDDDMGNGAGVNSAVHHFRFDVGLTRFLSWQNLFFVLNPRRGSNPSQQFYVLLPRGANTTYRFLSQLAFTF